MENCIICCEATRRIHMSLTRNEMDDPSPEIYLLFRGWLEWLADCRVMARTCYMHANANIMRRTNAV